MLWPQGCLKHQWGRFCLGGLGYVAWEFGLWDEVFVPFEALAEFLVRQPARSDSSVDRVRMNACFGCKLIDAEVLGFLGVHRYNVWCAVYHNYVKYSELVASKQQQIHYHKVNIW